MKKKLTNAENPPQFSRATGDDVPFSRTGDNERQTFHPKHDTS